MIAFADHAERMGSKRKRCDLMQRTIGLAAPARTSDMIIDKGVGHFALRPVLIIVSYCAAMRKSFARYGFQMKGPETQMAMPLKAWP
jgi:hypothetical protein